MYQVVTEDELVVEAQIANGEVDVVSNPEDACPDCGEQRIDYLVWNNQTPDDESVTCWTCKTVYVPPTYASK